MGHTFGRRIWIAVRSSFSLSLSLHPFLLCFALPSSLSMPSMLSQAFTSCLPSPSLYPFPGSYGCLSGTDTLWASAEASKDDVMARLSLINLVQEARGLDTSELTLRVRAFPPPHLPSFLPSAGMVRLHLHHQTPTTRRARDSYSLQTSMSLSSPSLPHSHSPSLRFPRSFLSLCYLEPPLIDRSDGKTTKGRRLILDFLPSLAPMPPPPPFLPALLPSLSVYSERATRRVQIHCVRTPRKKKDTWQLGSSGFAS